MGPGSTTEARETIAGESALTLVPTFVVVAVDATGMGIILPLLPFYSQRLGATPFLLGAPISVYAVCQLVAGQLIAGPVTAELSRSTAINRQGMIMGLNQSLMSGANIGAPLVSGALIGHRLFVPWALAMAAIAAIGAALAGQLLDTPRTR